MKCRPSFCASAGSVCSTACLVVSNDPRAHRIDSGGSSHSTTSHRPANPAFLRYPHLDSSAITTRLVARITTVFGPRNDTRNGWLLNVRFRPANPSRGTQRFLIAPTRHRQHLARKQADRMRHLLMGELAERELADEVIRAGLVGHGPDAVAHRRGRARDAAAVLDQRLEILRHPRKARLGTMQLPELHEALVEARPGAAPERHRLAVAVGHQDKAVDAEQGQFVERMA